MEDGCADFWGKVLGRPDLKHVIFPSANRVSDKFVVLFGRAERKTLRKYDKTYAPRGPGERSFFASSRRLLVGTGGQPFYDMDGKVKPKFGLDPFSETVCLLKMEVHTLLCSTCCCKGGRSKDDIKVALLRQEPGYDCQAWFTIMESALKGTATFFSSMLALRSNSKGRCFQ